MKLYDDLRKTLKDPFFDGLAEEYAFAFILSVVPLVLVTAQIAALFSISRELPDAVTVSPVYQALVSIIEDASTGTLGILAFAMVLWGSSRLHLVVIRTSEYVFDLPKEDAIHGRIYALLTSMLISFAITFGFFFMGILGELLKLIPQPQGMIFDVLTSLVYAFRWLVTGALFFVLVLLHAYGGTRFRVPIRRLVPGAVFTAFFAVVVSLLYSQYLTYFAPANPIYGSFSSIMLLLIWFQLLGRVFVLGMILNRVLYKREISASESQGRGRDCGAEHRS